MRKFSKNNKIWNIPIKEFKTMLETSESILQVLKSIGLTGASTNYKLLHERIRYEKIDITDLYKKIKQNNLKHIKSLRFKNATPMADIFANKKHLGSSTLKKRLLNEGFLKEECSICGLKNEWQGSSITLQLDHIDGDGLNNSLDNLRILCPNCHSQTKTFCRSSNNPWPSKKQNYCKECRVPIKSKGDRKCMKCRAKASLKIEWPDSKKLLQMVQESNYKQVGKQLGVSDNAVRKRLRTRGLL